MSRQPHTREIAVARGGVSPRQPANFQELQRNMEDELEKRRKDWEKEVEQMSEDFFNVKLIKKEPEGNAIQDGSNSSQSSSQMVSPAHKPLTTGTEILNIADSNDIYHVLPDGSKVYRQRFDVHGFEPGDLQVKVDGGSIRVSAKHQEKFSGRNTSSRQFNRQVDVPDDVNPDKLVSYLSPDGILTLEAPVERSRVSTPKREVQRHTIESSSLPFQRGSSPFGQAPPPQYEAIMRSPSPGSTGTVYNSPVIEDTECGKKMKMVIKMGGDYDPDDVDIKLHDHKVSVKAKREENVGGRSSKREFSRSFDLPKPLYKKSFRAVLTSDGKLVIGGSLRENEDQRAMSQIVYNDMPINGRPCYVEHA